MGLGTETQATETGQSVLAISSDQLYVDDDAKSKSEPNTSTEAAAITAAKDAALSFVQKHPETQVFDKEVKRLRQKAPAKGKEEAKKQEASAKQEKASAQRRDSANVELDLDQDVMSAGAIE